MEVYDNEHEQVEALKKWWKENGTSIIAGLVIGIGALVGWQSWRTYSDGQAVTASMQYEQLVALVEAGDLDQARVVRTALAAEHPGAYSSLGSLLVAKGLLDDGALDEAEALLREVSTSGKPDSVRHVARVRLGRVMLAQGRDEQLSALLEDVDSDPFSALYDELRGDLAVAQGNLAAARDAYAESLGGRFSAADTELLRMKLDDIGPASVSSSPEMVSPEGGPS